MATTVATFIEGKPTRSRNYLVVNCGICELEFNDGEFAVIRWNVTDHLEVVEPT